MYIVCILYKTFYHNNYK